MANSNVQIATVLIVLSIIGLVMSEWRPDHLKGYDCTGVPDGRQEIACWGRLDCSSGKAVFTICYPKMVYSRDLEKCVKKGTGNTDCMVSTACTSKDDGSYADVSDSCQTFFTCRAGKFKGRQYCPSNLRFNDKKKFCDFPTNFKCGP